MTFPEDEPDSPRDPDRIMPSLERSSNKWYLVPFLIGFFASPIIAAITINIFSHVIDLIQIQMPFYALISLITFLSGFLPYLLLKNRDPHRAQNVLILGVAIVVFWIFIAIIGIFMDDPDTFVQFPQEINNNDNTDTVVQFPQEINNNDNTEPISDTRAAVPVPPNVHSVISYNDIPSYADEEDTMQALKLAVFAWEQKNPSVEFDLAKDADGDVHIRWVRQLDDNTRGLWRHVDMQTIGNVDYVLIELGLYCDSHYQLYPKRYVAFIITHELGHHLGLGHITDPNHLMFSGLEPSARAVDSDYYDTRGYVVPRMIFVPYVCQ